MGKDKIVIIPVHNQLEYFKRALGSVMKYSPDAVVIVVDDGSTDKATREYLSANEGIYEFLYNETAQGFSAACNKGIQYTLDNFDFNCLCLLNSDAEVATENWFDKVEECFISDEQIGIAGVVSDNAMAQTIKNIPLYLKDIDNKPTLYSYFIHGFCYFISKKLIETIGLLDEKTFPHYGSEDSYSLDSIKHGFQNIIVGKVFVKHNNETSYSHAVRAKFVKTTLPTLQRKWGFSYVAKCVNQANNCGQYLNRT